LDTRQKAIKDAQRSYDREVGRARAKRQKAFAKAQRQGASLAEIGDLIGLSEARVEQIIKGAV
jgi:DNA-directed RNA polymerase specialized sigma24 family protein